MKTLQEVLDSAFEGLDDKQTGIEEVSTWGNIDDAYYEGGYDTLIWLRDTIAREVA